MGNIDEIRENFKFIVTETQIQVHRIHDFVKSPTRETYEKAVNRESYINNLKTIIENKCYACIHARGDMDARSLNRIRAVLSITANLERICDVGINILEQMGYLAERRILRNAEYSPMFQIIEESLDLVFQALEESSLPKALRICRSEYILDALYRSSFERLTTLINSSREGAGNCITAIFIYRYLERIGDMLLNVGEAILFAALGQRIKIEQFDSLRQTLENSGYTGAFEDINFQAIWGSRSGCRIGKIENAGGGRVPEHASLYKEGAPKKILREKENLEKWNALFPGSVPRIYGYNEDEDRSSLLVEFLSGCGFDDLIILQDEATVANAFFVLEKTVQHMWEKTLVPGPIAANFMQQLQYRYDEVRQVHPEFARRPHLSIGKARVLSIQSLVEQCRECEKGLCSPFSVLIHGDFNTNNIIYDHNEQTVRFIDLHRSKQHDYVQDVSVFLVSNFRRPIFDPLLRKRLNRGIAEFHSWALQFAREKEDGTMQARMAFALARSFFTSIRFEMNRVFAGEMFMRAAFLLESVSVHGQAGIPWEEFTFSPELLYYTA
ncbi:MAG: phosphotransferase [Desulfovibrio sp.]|jgi:phosphate uptake regulator/aminoglycoside phosphotransferase|nr:phosphotransferase [Desulfovibrio sp.]